MPLLLLLTRTSVSKLPSKNRDDVVDDDDDEDDVVVVAVDNIEDNVGKDVADGDFVVLVVVVVVAVAFNNVEVMAEMAADVVNIKGDLVVVTDDADEEL